MMEDYLQSPLASINDIDVQQPLTAEGETLTSNVPARLIRHFKLSKLVEEDIFEPSKREENVRISQGDIFKDIEIVETCSINKQKMELITLRFPYMVCLNQDCDLNSDYNERHKTDNDGNELLSNKDVKLFHLIVAPIFNYDAFKDGTHWNNIRTSAASKSKTLCQKIEQNEIPRYHYLDLPGGLIYPKAIIDFKHFFTIKRDVLYDNIDKRILSLDVLFRERLTQRFSNYFCRIGLPEDKSIVKV